MLQLKDILLVNDLLAARKAILDSGRIAPATRERSNIRQLGDDAARHITAAYPMRDLLPVFGLKMESLEFVSGFMFALTMVDQALKFKYPYHQIIEEHIPDGPRRD